MEMPSFEWDERKNQLNQQKHGVSFQEAQWAFYDDKRVIARDLKHGKKEERYYCFGMVNEGILTVRFTYRNKKIRIIGAGFWRKGKESYYEKKKIH